MANIVIICWLPWSWKTITSYTIRDYYDREKIPYALIPSDETYIEFMKKYYPYMVWEDIHKNLQYHYQQTSQKIQEEFYEYLLSKVNNHLHLGNIVIEWRHITEILYRLNVELGKSNVLTNVYMDKDKVMIMKWVNTVRDMDVYKHILSLN